MTFSLLALVVGIGLLGPLLAAKTSWNVPVVIGELLGGLAIGSSGLRLVDPADPSFSLLASIGFGLTMFVVGSHVPVRDPAVRSAIARSLLGAVLVGVLAVPLGLALSAAFGTGHAALYAVLIASSSAALILPIIGSLRMDGPRVLQLTAQVAIADAVCIVVLPLAIDPAEAGPAALGALLIAGCALVLFFVLRALDRRRLKQRLHEFSERRRFALELRLNLLFLFALAALAEFTHVSIMLAGFALGLVIGALGEPHRLTRQLFGITEGFFGPLFFVWLGSTIDLGHLAAHPSMILLGFCLGIAGIVAHLAARATGLPWLLAVMSAGQLGVPVAAAALGTQLHLLEPGEDAALLLGAIITIGATALAGSLRARRLRSGSSPRA
ncbi:MAG TPA: cation:proton antiporter [Lacisediminihabitans sp.]|uniref:cation:proton antiporter n=1 Tax=Lacisediminihabitans sp. TaxID=2787631 RepID=UPI002EDA41D6